VDSRFEVLASQEASGTSTTCDNKLASLVCSGRSTPEYGNVPFFYVSCGASTYFGPNPYHFTPSFGSIFPGHGNTNNLVRSYLCDGLDASIRPSWKLLGFFNPAGSGCTSLANATYDETVCLTQVHPTRSPMSKDPVSSPISKTVSLPILLVS